MHVHTVRGPIEPEALGMTLMHEHTFCDLWDWGGRRDYNSIVDDADLLIDELNCYRTAGGTALVDLTTEDIGRNPLGLRRLSESTGLHLVMGSGWYRERVYPPFIRTLSTNQLADRIVREFADGVEGTGIRPGIIGEVGTERFCISPDEERVFRAAARAQRTVGATISTHTTHFGDLALDQVALLREEGVPAERIVIGHLGERRGAADILAVAARGVFVQIDHIGRPASAGTQPESQRARNVAEVVRAGHLDQVLISMDICANSLLHWNGGHGYDYLLTHFIPLLQQEGLDEAQIRSILIDNPRRALAF